MQAALSASQAAQFLNISERRFHQLRHDPAFPKARAVGTRNRWVTEELLAYLKALPPAQELAEPVQLGRSRKRRNLEPIPEAWPSAPAGEVRLILPQSPRGSDDR